MIGVLTEEEPAAVTANDDPADIFAAQAEAAQKGIKKMLKRYPNISVAAATMRRVHTAGRNDWGSIALINGEFHRSRNYANLDIMDRIGGGDGFVAGLIYGLLTKQDPALTIELAAAHGALAMSTPGDTSMATLAEVLKLAQGGDAKVQR
jgi:2-dehydro-3-deoxygluconokinase